MPIIQIKQGTGNARMCVFFDLFDSVYDGNISMIGVGAVRLYCGEFLRRKQAFHLGPYRGSQHLR